MTVKRVRFLQELLKFMGLEGRLHLEWISSAEAQKFVQVVTDFTNRIKALGPSPLSVLKQRTQLPRPRDDSKQRHIILLPDYSEKIDACKVDSLLDREDQARSV
jgi:F420-non-reducing hydrogenase iron-sulfur subunit